MRVSVARREREPAFAVRPASAARLLAIGLLALTACSGGVTDSRDPVAPPVDTTGGGGGGGVVPRGSLTLTVTVDPADAALAQAAGVGVAGLPVRVQRRGAAEAPRTVTTDASGRVQLDGLLSGTYEVVVDRALTPTEVAQLPTGDRDATLFTGAGTVLLGAPQSASATLPLVATRRGSLVISELHMYIGPEVSGGIYNWGSYVEVYNNADTTVFLDGLIVFRSTPQQHNQYDFTERTCEAPHALVRLDSTRVAASIMFVFPGSGREHPVPPGEARVLAMDALDHRTAAPSSGQMDLSRAHFEEVASDGDTDNPLAVNVLRFTPGTGALGRGYPVQPGRLFGIARPTTPTPFELPRVEAPFLGNFATFAIPRSALLDAVAPESTIERIQATAAYAGGIRPCDPWIAPAHDRAVAFLVDYHRPGAIRRKTVGVTPDGREILQRTRTSARDLEYAPPLLRSLRKRQ